MGKLSPAETFICPSAVRRLAAVAGSETINLRTVEPTSYRVNGGRGMARTPVAGSIANATQRNDGTGWQRISRGHGNGYIRGVGSTLLQVQVVIDKLTPGIHHPR